MRGFSRIATGAAAVMAGWGLYSLRESRKAPPPEAEALSYLRSFMSEHGLGAAMDRFTTDTVQSDGVELKLYLFESSPEDPAVVFVPGTGVYALLYLEFMSKLADSGFNVVGYDCRGHGLSSGSRGRYTIGQMASDTSNVVTCAVERYGGRVSVAGSSQGGIVAFYAAAADDRLRSAVCHNLLAPDEPDSYRMTRYPGLYRTLLPLTPMMSVLPGGLRLPVSLYLDLNAEPCKMMPDVKGFMKNDPLVVTSISLDALASLSSTPLAKPVEEIGVPVMVVHSEFDNIFPADYVERVFSRLTCRKKMLSLAGAPHLLLIDYVDDVLPDIVSWLDETLR